MPALDHLLRRDDEVGLDVGLGFDIPAIGAVTARAASFDAVSTRGGYTL